ncbi:MAG: ABC transporter permease, partial [Rhodospirillales bacterium]|nr:ABC transporter permease [Rhodospirillales bacterium]
MVEFWHLYSRSRSAVLGLGILLVVVFLAAIANFIYPEAPFRL